MLSLACNKATGDYLFLWMCTTWHSAAEQSTPTSTNSNGPQEANCSSNLSLASVNINDAI